MRQPPTAAAPRLQALAAAALALVALSALGIGPRGVAAQAAGVGPVRPNVTTFSGPEFRVTRAARMLLGQSSDNFLGLGVEYNKTFCMDNDAEQCPVGQRATVACRENGEVYIMLNTTKVVEGDLVANMNFLEPQDGANYEFKCGLDPVEKCVPEINEMVLGNFSSVTDDLADVVGNCTAGKPTVVICTGETDNGGTMAALCGYWAAQVFPSAQITVITFDSNWEALEVNLAFLALYGRFVQWTVDDPRTVQLALSSTGIVSSGGWGGGQDGCGESPQCKVTQAVRASCALQQDVSGDEQFLEEYPGAVVMYVPLTEVQAGAPNNIAQAAAVMWVPESSTAVFVFANDRINAETLQPGDYTAMVPLWDAKLLHLDEAEFAPYEDYYVASSAPELPNSFKGGDPQVVESFLSNFSLFFDVPSSKLQCTGIYNCYKFVSGSSPPNVVICAGQGVAGGTAGMCAAWAALRFPQAQVVWVNAGSPQPVGNPDFYRFITDANGNFYTLVNGVDPVPRATSCAANASGMAVPSVATYYANATGLMQAEDPLYKEVDCSYLNLDPALRAPNMDNMCSSYLTEVLGAEVSAPINLGPQVPFVGRTQQDASTWLQQIDMA